MQELRKKLPFIAVSNQKIYPYVKTKIRVGKANSVEALQMAYNSFDKALAITFVDNEKHNGGIVDNKEQLIDDVVVATITDFKEKNGIYTVTLEGSEAAKLIEIETNGKSEYKTVAEIEVLADTKAKLNGKEFDKLYEQFNVLRESLTKAIKNLKSLEVKTKQFENQINLFTDLYNATSGLELKQDIKNDVLELTSTVSFRILESFEDLSWEEFNYALSQYLNPQKIVEFAIQKLEALSSIKKVEDEINRGMREDMEDQQRDFYLREKMRQIKKMLNEDESQIDDIAKDSTKNKQFPKYVLDTLQKEQSKLASMMPSSPEANISRTYIDLLLKLPWRKVSQEIINIQKVREILDSHHYGLEKPKKRILEFISVLTHTQNQNAEKEYEPIKGDDKHFIDKNLFVNQNGSNRPINNIPILTLVGPPGTGKTTLAKSIADALDREFVKVSLGGVKDESEIRGHRRTYVGAMPGKIISAIKKSGVSNPVILLDEIDKMSADFRGDPTSAMLEVLDPEQNANFQDHYLELEYDLSKVLFIATANYYEQIPPALIDRVEILQLSTYTVKEKLEIAKTHLLPKVYAQNALKPSQMQIDDETIEFIIRHYTLEAGVRELKRLLDTVARKIVVKFLDGEIKDEFVVTKEIVEDFLGPVKFDEKKNDNEAGVGVVNGLAWTPYGGSVLSIEVTSFPGKEGLKLTGQLKDVMKESAQIALNFVRANAVKFGVDFDFDNNSVHIHVPEGAVPKDGPSAGVTFTTSIISALSKRSVPANIGMTGEITLRGKVLPIGGLKEKSLAASHYGIKKIFIPWDNRRLLIEVPEEVKKEIEFIPVKQYEEIYEHIFKK
ncbi:endopeptidase La [[Mycoplasma] falconis]|uniref:Lon protease n=1 Tax=[Mycoplasma] falconis TaxID=92403 RepID=A0A501X896_9BACT|nr:endopeptidase La [[Mycoplasma] falconis]TPE56761.1 endopeptidase La [[Mycoplasma] falconis]